MAHEVDPHSCERTPEAIRAALQRRPDWLQAFEQDWLSAAADFDQPALDSVTDKREIKGDQRGEARNSPRYPRKAGTADMPEFTEASKTRHLTA